MGPRKKAKLDNPAASNNNSQNGSLEGSTHSDAPNVGNAPARPDATTESASGTEPAGPTMTAPESLNEEQDAVRPDSSKSGSWYSGSWRSKAPALTKIDRGSVPSSERPKLESSDRAKQAVGSSPAQYMPTSSRRSSKTIPLAASTTKLNVTSNSSSDSRAQENWEAGTAEPKDPPLPPDPAQIHGATGGGEQASEEQRDKGQEPAKPAVSTWRGWWSKPDPAAWEGVKEKMRSDEFDKTGASAKETPLPESPEAAKTSDPIAAAKEDKTQPSGVDSAAKDGPGGGPTPASQNRSSWFWLWSRAQNAKNDPPTDDNPSASSGDQPPTESVQGPVVQITPPSAPATPADEKSDAKNDPPKSSGWAFWSREKSKPDDVSDSGSTHKQIGELAVADTPSQSRPEAAQFNEHEETSKKQPVKTSKRGRIAPNGREATSKTATPAKGTPSGSPTRKSTKAATAPPSRQPSTQRLKSKPHPQPQAQLEPQPKPVPTEATKEQSKNSLLPKFDSTYHATQATSYWEQLRRFFLWTAGETPRLRIEPNPPRIRRALAIGVHGFFPAAIFRQVLGQPTGTSIRFANFAAAAIKDWVVEHGDYECEIEKVALEGEGFIADRVDTLWKLLLNWIGQIRRADFILVAAHSQGVPVAVMLVAKLIQFGCINSDARIGICAMAGVNMGPFIEYKTSLFGSTANELFEFSRPDSKVSLMYEEALDVVLGHGVRITYIGSIDDQLVSLESSTFAPITHPYIYRAVFVPSALQQKPDFIASLVGFTLKLRNLGVPDHGLIRELSPALAGSLVSGDGHSRLYDDPSVYALTVRCALETTTLLPRENPKVERWGLSSTSTRKSTEEKGKEDGQAGPGAVSATASTASSNPFFLPWAMRGVLEEELVRKELGEECRELLALFEGWRPQSKGLKDVRFRLEAVRSKL